MRAFRITTFSTSLVFAALLAMPSYGEEKVTNAAWDAPSAKVDSSVAAWATQRLRPRSASTHTVKPVDSPAAVNAFLKIDEAASSPPPRVEPVRYEQPVASNSIRQNNDGSNSLRLSQSASTQASSPSSGSDAARLAFAEREPDETTEPTANPFANLPVEPSSVEPVAQRYQLEQQVTNTKPTRLKAPVERLAPVERTPEPYRLATRSMADEPRSFDPMSNAAPARSMYEEPSVITIPEEAFGDGALPVEPTPLPITQPRKESREKLASTQQALSSVQKTPEDFQNDWSDAPLASSARKGTGRPGGRELQGPQEGSLVVEKRGPEEARVGQTSRFLLTIRNTGQSAAKNVVLYDETPEGAELVEAIPPAANKNGRLVWRLGSMAPGEERSVEIRIKPLREGTIGSVASVSFETAASATMRSTRPLLAIRIRAAERVLVGQKQRVEIELHNPGTGIATGVVLVENVPDNLRHEAGPELEMEIGDLAPGETRRLDLTLTAAQAGRAVNTVTAFANGDLRAEKSVTFDVVAPSLQVSIDGPKRRYLERPATYTINIDNPGTAPAKDVRLVTHLPQGLKFVSANNMGEYDNQTHSVYWSLAELPEGERGAVEMVGLPITAGEHTLRVEGEAKSGLKAAESQPLLIEGLASLSFDVRDLQDPIEIGAEAAYDIVVTNEGTKSASGVRVVLEAPAGMKVVSAKGHTAHRLSDNRVEFAPIDHLEPGVKVLYRVRLRGERPGDQRVVVSVESDDLRTPIRREESTRVFGDE